MHTPVTHSIPFKSFTTHIVSLLMLTLILVAVPATATSVCDTDCQSEMLTMAYIANLSAGMVGTQEHIATATADRIQCALGGEIGSLGDGWKTVWGPVVHLHELVAANTMFVVQYEATNIYVVAIAGTNPKSFFDWIVEDLFINMVSWPGAKASAKAGVTDATLTGLDIIKEMVSDGPDGQRQSLREFLKGIAAKSSVDNKATVYVAGHSLGGALAPAVALWLSDERDDWDPNVHTTLQVYAFAGATPGNQGLADYMNT